MTDVIRMISTVASWIIALVMGLSLLILLIRYFTEPIAPGIAFPSLMRRLLNGRPLHGAHADDSSTANRGLRRRLRRNEWALHNQMHILAWVICVVILSRLLIFASALIGCWLDGSLTAFFHDFEGHWIRWDAGGYLALAKEGYTEANRANLVLLPLYPALVRMLSPLMLGNMELTAVLLSNLSLVGAGWALYSLVYETHGTLSARRAVQLLMFSPLSVFFSVPYAESTFLFLTMLSILLARRQQFIGAVIVGVAASFTRLAGIFTIIPVLQEILKHERRIHLWPRHKRRFIFRVVLRTILTMGISLGLFAYLLINKISAGSWFAFVDVQAQYWNQTFGSISNTFKYSLETALTTNAPEWLMGVWLPQCVGIVLTSVLLLLISPRSDPGDGLYSWAYLSATLAPTWLLTGPRMIFGMYTTYIMLTRAARKKWVYVLLMLCFVPLMIVCSYMYTVMGNLL